eukprot:2691155-Prymnesium_polylepis.1
MMNQEELQTIKTRAKSGSLNTDNVMPLDSSFEHTRTRRRGPIQPVCRVPELGAPLTRRGKTRPGYLPCDA